MKTAIDNYRPPRTPSRLTSICIFLYCCAFPEAHAAAAQSDTLLVSAPGVESTTVSELAKYGNKLEVITRQQIERAGPDADVTRVLQMYVPGFYVAPQYGPFDYANYSLLGGQNSDTLIMLDGVRLNNRLYGGLYLDTLPITAIERIEVLKGAQSLSFGTQAVSGVINIVTRTPASTELSGEMSVGADTFGGRSGEARVEKETENALGHLGWMLYVNRSKSEGYQPYRSSDLNGNVTDKRRSYDITTLGGKVTQTFFDRACLELFYQYTEANLDYARPNNNRKTTNDRVQSIVTATWQDFVNDDFSYFVKGHLNDWDTRYTRINNLAGGGIDVLNHNDYWGFRDWGVQVEGKWRFWQEHELVFGTDNQWYEGQDDVMIIDKNTAAVHGFYTQLRPEITWLPQWHPSVGVRHEQMEGGGDATVWMLSSGYDLTNELQLRGQVGTAFNLPNAEQLFVNEPGSEMGNRNLKPEKSRNAEVGFDYRPAWNNQALTLSATAYARNISNLITLSGDQWINGEGEIDVRGFEANGELAVTPQWKIGMDFNRNIIGTSHDATVNNIPVFFSRARLNYQSQDERWGGEVAVCATPTGSDDETQRSARYHSGLLPRRRLHNPVA